MSSAGTTTAPSSRPRPAGWSGIKVKVGGDIDAALLPFPSVTLRAIAIGPVGEGSRMRARSLRIELALGPLMRGELRATEMRLVAPQFNIGLDSEGQIDWPPLALANETLSIDRLQHRGRPGDADRCRQQVEAGARSVVVHRRGAFADRADPRQGRVRHRRRSLRLRDFGRREPGPDGTRLRFSLKTDERPLTVEAEGLLAFERGAPRFDGALTLSRPAGAVLASGKAVAFEPWRLTSKVKAGASAAALDEVSFQYGPDERAVTLAGSGEFKFGAQPQLQGTLSARQVDLDRLLATPEAPRRLPLAAVQAFGEMLGSALRPSWPVQACAQRRRHDARRRHRAERRRAICGRTATPGRSTGSSFARPGSRRSRSTAVSIRSARGLALPAAPASIPTIPRTWWPGSPGSAVTAAQYKPWRAKGDVTLRADRIAVERLRTEIDRGVVEGSVSYAWPAGDRPARLDGELRAAELDLDGVFGFGESALSGLGLERPGEVTLAMEIGRAKIAGFDARNIAARLKLDAGGLAIERLSIGDLGDTSFVATGRIQTQSSPGGSITVNLDARDLNGILALCGTVCAGAGRSAAPARGAPEDRDAASQRQHGEQRRRWRQRQDRPDRQGRRHPRQCLGERDRKARGVRADRPRRAGRRRCPYRRPVRGRRRRARCSGCSVSTGSPRPSSKPARLDVSANGPLGRELRFEGKLAAGPIDAGGKGTLRFASDQPATLDFDQFAGAIGGNKVQGRWALRFERYAADRRVDRGGRARRAGGDRGSDRNAGASRRGRVGLVHRADSLERDRPQRPHRLSRRSARCSRLGWWRSV